MQRLYAAIVVLLLCFYSGFSLADDGLRGKRILLINSYDPLFPTYARRIKGINSVFKDTSVTIDVEFMDSKRHFDSQSQALFLTLLARKISKRPAYDVVMTSDDNALELVLQNRGPLFPGVPIVFTGLNNEELGLEMDTHQGVTGVIESVSTSGSLDLMASIDPTRNKLAVIVDGTPSGQADLRRIRKAVAARPAIDLTVIDLSALSWLEYEQSLRQLDETYAILLLSAFRDRDDQSISFPETLDRLVRNTDGPIYDLWEHGLGQGILGDLLINQYEQGRQAGLRALAILGGTPVAQIPVLDESTNQPMFDFNQLKRHNIDFALLPSNSKILFRPRTLWNNYRQEVVAALVTIALLALVAAYLGRESLLRTRLMRESEKQKDFVRGLMNTMPDLIWLKDPNGRYLSCNRRFEALYGEAEEDILGRTDFDFVSPDLARRFRKHDQLALERGGPSRNEERVVFKSDGHEEILETIKTPLKAANGDVIGVLGVSRDITARVAAEAKIRTLLQAVEQSPVSVMICDFDGKIEYVNQSFEKTSGYAEAEALGRNIGFLQADATCKESNEAMWAVLKQSNGWEGEQHNRRKSGELFWEYAYVSPIFSEDNSVSGYLTVKEDITIRRRQEEKIRFQAQFDSLTKLPNRDLSHDRLQQMIKSAQRSQTKVGVLYIDLDDFKKVNDTLGHNVGDELLVHVGRRLLNNLREGDTVGRLGGDEFIVLISEVNDALDGNGVATHLIRELEKPILLDDRQLVVSASIGVAIYPDDGQHTVELMRKADLAMYSAKQNGGSHCAFYTSQLNEIVERRFLVEQHIRGALERGEFNLVYQPKVCLKTERVMGVEVLLRWNNPSLGTVAPNEFIPIAEQAGAISAIGHFVIEESLTKLRSMIDSLGYELVMSINLSPRQFRDQSLDSKILALVEKCNIAPTCVEFEITEGLLIDELPSVNEILTRLNEVGFKIAMDDFGTGYSSLSYLRRYPFDTLKIDREFIQSLEENYSDRNLVKAAISMAQSLDLDVVAEGVETENQKKILGALSCDIIQGYLYSKPVPEFEIEAVINAINNMDNLSPRKKHAL